MKNKARAKWKWIVTNSLWWGRTGGINISVISYNYEVVFFAMDDTVRHFKGHDKAKAINKRN